jgi:hypothetical protein
LTEFILGWKNNFLVCSAILKERRITMQKAILEEQIEPIAVQLPALPDNIKDIFVKIMPILAIVWVDAQWFGLDCATGGWDY